MTSLLLSALLLQAAPAWNSHEALFQKMVDRVSRELNIAPVTVVKATGPWGGAATMKRIYVNPLVLNRDFPASGLEWLAYHEVCHIALKHPLEEDKAGHEYEAHLCVLDHLILANRKFEAYSTAWKYIQLDKKNERYLK